MFKLQPSRSTKILISSEFYELNALYTLQMTKKNPMFPCAFFGRTVDWIRFVTVVSLLEDEDRGEKCGGDRFKNLWVIALTTSGRS